MNFFVVHFIDFRNGLTFADKKLKCLIILMCSFMHYVRGLVAQLFWCHEKTNPRCTRPATVYIDHHYVPSEEKICDKGANSRMYTLVKGSRDLLQEDD